MTRLPLLVACAASFTACQFFTAGSDLEVTVDVQPSSLRPGVDTTLITVMAHNRSDQEITLSGSRYCTLRYEVWDSTGQRVRDPVVCDDALWSFRIAPNDSLASTFAWSGQVWEVVGSFEWRKKLLESGRYRVVGVLNANERQERSGAVEIELVQPQS